MCTGESTIADITDALAARHAPVPLQQLTEEVLAFLRRWPTATSCEASTDERTTPLHPGRGADVPLSPPLLGVVNHWLFGVFAKR